jgi:RND family efflux transporter MFP subunit
MSVDPGPTELSRQRRRVWLTVTLVSAVAIGAAGVGAWSLSDGSTGAAEGQRDRARTVRAATARRGSLTLRAEYTGELAAEVAELSSQVTGRLEKVNVDIGDVVESGQLLARIDASMAQRQLTEASAQSRGAEAAQRRVQADLEAAAVELERGEALASSGLLSQKELDALEATREGLQADLARAKAQREQAAARAGVLAQTVSETRIVAPFDGAVAERFLDPGALTQPGTKILRLVKSGPLRVRFRAPERDLGRVRVGMQFGLSTQATGERRFEGTITRLSAEVSRQDRAAAVEGTLGAETPELRPGMYARVELVLGELRDVVLVSSSAIHLMAADGRAPVSGVFKIEAGRAVFQKVTPLGEADSTTAVRGLDPSAQVITLGHENLKDGAPVRIARDDAP